MAANVDESYRSSFNPFDALDPNSDETIDEAARLADAIVVVKDDSHDPFWDESARADGARAHSSRSDSRQLHA
jgi:hypothetical protein